MNTHSNLRVRYCPWFLTHTGGLGMDPLQITGRVYLTSHWEVSSRLLTKLYYSPYKEKSGLSPEK